MRSILVHVDTLDVLAIDVATQVGALVYDETPLALLVGEMGEGGSEETGTYYKIVIYFIGHNYLFEYLIIILGNNNNPK